MEIPKSKMPKLRKGVKCQKSEVELRNGGWSEVRRRVRSGWLLKRVGSKVSSFWGKHASKMSMVWSAKWFDIEEAPRLLSSRLRGVWDNSHSKTTVSEMRGYKVKMSGMAKTLKLACCFQFLPPFWVSFNQMKGWYDIGVWGRCSKCGEEWFRIVKSSCVVVTKRDSGEIYKKLGRHLREICKTWDF